MFKKISLNGINERNNVLPLFLSGFHFGVLQTSIFFAIEVFVTATYVGYFLVALVWMGSVAFALQTKHNFNYKISLLGSFAAFATVIVISDTLLPIYLVYSILVFLIFISAFPVGIFFKENCKTIKSSTVFLHENNGFVIGVIFSLVFFLKYGVNFIYVGTLTTLVLLNISLFRKNIVNFLYPLILIAIHIVDFYLFGIVISVLLLVAMLLSLLLLQKELSQNEDTQEKFNVSEIKLRALLFLSGVNLIFLQFYIVREFSSILSANELTILIVSSAYFIGFSFGYYIVNKINMKIFRVISLSVFIIHIIIFAGIKYLASVFLLNGYGYAVLLLLVFVTSLLTSSYYSIFLPKIIQQEEGTVSTSYPWELFGSAFGILALLLMIYSNSQLLSKFYFIFLFAILVLLFQQSKYFKTVLISGGCILALFFLFETGLANASTQKFYSALGYSNPKIVFSSNSFYHSIEIIDSYKTLEQKEKKRRASFLNGIKYFDNKYNSKGEFAGNTSLSEFTYFLAELPAKYLEEKLERPLRVLILGGGSLSSINRVSPYSSKTTLVEIDPEVVRSSKECWKDFNKYDEITNYEIIIDDAKHYLKRSTEKFDLIIMDISAPYYLGTALLHNREFYSLIKEKLNDDGIFSESTQDRPLDYNPRGMGIKILRGIRDVFPTYRVIDCNSKPRGMHGYVMAANSHSFSSDHINELLELDGMHKGTAIYTEDSTYYNFEHVKPYSLTNMETLLEGNLNRIKSRLLDN